MRNINNLDQRSARPLPRLSHLDPPPPESASKPQDKAPSADVSWASTENRRATKTTDQPTNRPANRHTTRRARPQVERSNRRMNARTHLDHHLVQAEEAEGGLEEAEAGGDVEHGVQDPDRLVQHAPRVRHVVRDRERAPVEVRLDGRGFWHAMVAEGCGWAGEG